MLRRFSLTCAVGAVLLFPLPVFAGHDHDDHRGGWRGGGWHGGYGGERGDVDFHVYVGPSYPYYGYAAYPYYGYYYPYGYYPYYYGY